jgi:hypothetical protein
VEPLANLSGANLNGRLHQQAEPLELGRRDTIGAASDDP